MELSESTYTFLERILQCKSLRVYDDDLDRYKCQDFWCSENVVEWFKAQGYTPYKRNPEEGGEPSLYTSPSLPFAIIQEADYPFAYHHAAGDDESEPSLTKSDSTGRIIFAQDRGLRHVAIKAMHTESEEYRIAHFLSHQSLEIMRESCILPVIELLYFRKACFVVMPRWGPGVQSPKNHTMRGLLCIMRSLLKVRICYDCLKAQYTAFSNRPLDIQALVFLHSHNIIHRDLSFANILVNHFGPDSFCYWSTRLPQMSAGLLTYAVIDFDLAMMLPSTADRKSYTLPFRNAFQGSDGPHDVSQGELEYNPYAYDVGCLGVMFCSYYQHHTKDIPLLAPLLDKMVTRNISSRFTAEEALLFVEKILVEVEPAQLSIVEYPDPSWGAFTYETYDRWQGLPDEFQAKWAMYREPFGVPLTSRVLRAIIRTRVLPRFTKPRIRWLISRVVNGQSLNSKVNTGSEKNHEKRRGLTGNKPKGTSNQSMKNIRKSGES